MAEKTTKKTSSPCEQYIVTKLESVERELESLKNEHELLKKIHQDTIDLIKQATKRFDIKSFVFTEIYYNGSFVILGNEKDEELNDLLKLILLGKRIVEREK